MRKRWHFLLIITVIFILFLPIITSTRVKKQDKKTIISNYIDLTSVIEIDYSKEIDAYRERYHNNEVVAILNILNTDYRRPVMQHTDNDYYLNHLEDNTSNYMGALFADFRVNVNDGKKILIYGHNSKYIDMPFKILEHYYDIDYFQNHQYMELITSKEKKLYQIFSIYVEPTDYSYMQVDFNSTDSWYNHLLKLKQKSMYDTGNDIQGDDEILILQTCSTHEDYKQYKNKYLLIILRRIKNEEKIY